MQIHRYAGVACLAATMAAGSGCALFHRMVPKPMESPPVIRPTSTTRPPRSEGSLWAGNDGWSPFADDKADGPGDLVLVQIMENASAERKSATEIERSSSIDAGLDKLFGYESEFGTGRRVRRDKETGALLGHRQDWDLEHLIRSKSDSKFDADARLTQSGTIVANVMAQVIERRPDGNLRIFGSQVVTINNEDQVVTVSGLVRPSDVGSDNSILSTLVADARILYSGRGPATAATRPGWAFRVFYAVWPF